jgi:uncharacterized protein YjbI with pentapeptide repeats
MNESNWLSKLWRRIGIEDKTLWDLLQLLIVPILLAILGVGLNDAANDRQRRDAKERYQQEVLKEYFDVMSVLLRKEDLRNKKSGDPVSDLAGAYTLNALETLDSKYKRSVVRLLFQTDLIEGYLPIVSLQAGYGLRDVDLSNMYLWKVNLVGADLHKANFQGSTLCLGYLMGANFSNADMRKTNLWHANLQYANLEFADFSGANLLDANLNLTRLTGVILQNALYSEKTTFPKDFDPKSYGAIYIGPKANLTGLDLKDGFLRNVNLEHANIKNANLSKTQLMRSNLRSVDLTGANLKQTYLQDADLTNANLTNADLTDAEIDNAIFCNTIMPNGSINNTGCPKD